ncbi:MAG: hypothetical protein RLZZ450_1113 [Pseudomonadota bacterium]|jgi:hypothetical protein
MSTPLDSTEATLPMPVVDRVERALAANTRLATVVLLWLGTLIAGFYYAGIILRRDMYSQDMPVHTPWTYRLQDPGLFPNDLLTNYLEQFSPAGVRAIFTLSAPFVDPAVLAEVSALPICALALCLLYHVGRLSAGDRRLGGWLAILLVSARLLESPHGVWFHMFQGNLARCYAFPVLLAGCYGMLAKRPWMIGAACLAGALFYPPAALILGLLCGALFLTDALWDRCQLRSWVPALLLAGLAGAYLAGLSWGHSASPYGRLITLPEALRMPEFGVGGPLAAVLPKPSVWASMVELRFGLHAKLVVIAITYAVLAARNRVSLRVGRLAALVAAIGLCLFIAAYAVLFKLYEPSRYVYLAYYLAAVMLAVPVALRALDWTGQYLERLRVNWTALRRVGVLGGTVALLSLSAAVIAVTSRRARRGEGGQLSLTTEEVYRAIKTLPKSTMVAGHPVDVSDIPLFAQRPVFASNCALQPYFQPFYSTMRERLDAYYRAAYSPTWSEVEKFASQNHIDLILVNKDRYTAHPPRWVGIYDEQSDRLLEAGRAQGFALLHPPPNRVMVSSGRFSLIDLRNTEHGYAGRE